MTPKVLHIVSSDRWTGAAAPAFAEVEALRAAGVDAHYAYVGGYTLEEKLVHLGFAHPVIDRDQNPITFVRSVRALRRLVAKERFDVIHAHLSWDHWLARFVAIGSGVMLARTFHARRVLRADPTARWLMRGTKAVFIVNETFSGSPVLAGRNAVFTPPPLDHRQFTPDGGDARGRYGLRPDEPVAAFVGKMSKGRGFEEAFETFAELRGRVPAARLLLIGRGETRAELEALATSLGIMDAIVWAGYHETDLAEHYRAADILLFTAPGSDEGHRAVLEAMGCGVAPAAYPVEGIARILGDELSRAISPEAAPAALARTAAALLTTALDETKRMSAARSREFGFEAAAARLVAGYRAAL